MRSRKLRLLLAAAFCAAGIGASVVKAAAPATPQGFINFYTYAGDARAGIRAGTAVPDGSFYPKRAEGPYAGYPGPDLDDDTTLPGDNVRDNYTMHLKGYFYPPRTGRIQLAIASDDPGELYLSTDDNPANKRLIATEPEWNGRRSFGGDARRGRVNDGTQPADRLQNQSAFINVTANRPLYIEAFASEGGGGDNLAVAFRYDSDPEFADGDLPIGKAFISPFTVPTAPQLLAQPRDAFAYAGGAATFSIGIDVGPTATINSIKWTKNGADIPDSNASSITIRPATADDGAKIRATVTTSIGTLQSNEATLHVATIVAKDFVLGSLLWEAYTGIGGTAVSSLTDDPKYPNSPDQVRVLTAFEAPIDLMDNFGARISGFIAPLETADYVFYISADDGAELWLSTDDNPANKKLIAAEPQWNGARQWATTDRRDVEFPENRSSHYLDSQWPGASPPDTKIRLTAGRRYYVELLYKEGGGGDNGAATWTKFGDPVPANGSPALRGAVLGANAKLDKGDPVITKQPVFPPHLEEGRDYRFTVEGRVDPAGFGFTPTIQWQRNGVTIGSGGVFRITGAKASDAGTYRAVIGSPSGRTVNSVEATLAVVPDTFPPVPSAGAILKNGKQEIGVGFDEAVKLNTANVLANYKLSAGTLESIRVVNRPATGFDPSLGVTEYNGIVLVASGLTPGQSYTLTVSNVEDLKGNKIPASGATATFVAEGDLTWTVVGANESGFANDVVRTSQGSFEVVSSGVGFWSDYDEGTFVNQKVKGNFDAKVQLIEQDPSSQWARTGLMAREGLDAGKGRPDQGGFPAALEGGVYNVPKETLFSRLQTVHANPTIRWDAGVANNSYENHYRNEATYAAAWGNQLNSADGGFGPLDYPNIWMRLQRDGNFLVTYRSSNGSDWIQMTRREFQNLAEDLFVGPFYMPELNNNGTKDGLGHGVLARFRNYSITGANITPPPGGGGDAKFTGISSSGGKVTITWTGSGTLQRADAINGPWTDVAGATSPRTVDATGAAAFYRFKP